MRVLGKTVDRPRPSRRRHLNRSAGHSAAGGDETWRQKALFDRRKAIEKNTLSDMETATAVVKTWLRRALMAKLSKKQLDGPRRPFS